MRTLILSCNTGEGHNSAAKAIQELYLKQGQPCEIADALAFISPGVSRFLSWGHVFMYRHLPWLFTWGYSSAEDHKSAFSTGTVLYRFFERGAHDLFGFIQAGGYTSVLCTHPFSALMLTAVLRRYSPLLHTAFVATDYTCSPGVADSDLDFYFIPDEILIPEFESWNIAPEKLIASGIPVRQMFYEEITTVQAKEALGIDPEQTHIVLMCGSMGCGPIGKLTDALLRELPENTVLSVVCGTNDKLKRRLARKYPPTAKLQVYGYIQDMSCLLSSADLYITKPGGISVTEAADRNLPMVLIRAVAGCEDNNTRFFVDMGGAISGRSVQELAGAVLQILTDTAKYVSMKVALTTQNKHNAAQVIYDTMEEAEVKMGCCWC